MIHMNNTQERIARCFTSVFPKLRRDEIANASTASVGSWDSLAHVRLLSAVAEEFGLDLDMDDYETLVSFPLILQYVETKVAHG
jgi:acyl carrier protein